MAPHLYSARSADSLGSSASKKKKRRALKDIPDPCHAPCPPPATPPTPNESASMSQLREVDMICVDQWNVAPSWFSWSITIQRVARRRKNEVLPRWAATPRGHHPILVFFFWVKIRHKKIFIKKKTKSKSPIRSNQSWKHSWIKMGSLTVGRDPQGSPPHPGFFFGGGGWK